MKRIIVFAASALAAGLLFASAASAEDAQVTFVTPIDPGTITIDPNPPIVTPIIFPLIPAPPPAPPAFVLEGTAFNLSTQRPVKGVQVVRVLPPGHAPPPTRTFYPRFASDANGLYSTVADTTQHAGMNRRVRMEQP